MDIKNASEADLLAEIAARQLARTQTPDKPSKLLYPDFKSLVGVLEQHMAEIASKGYGSKDIKQYTWEAAVEGLYGKSIWPWLKQRDKGE